MQEQGPEQQELTMEGMVIQDLANQVAAITVDRAGWKARALKAEETLESLMAQEADEAKAEAEEGE